MNVRIRFRYSFLIAHLLVVRDDPVLQKSEANKSFEKPNKYRLKTVTHYYFVLMSENYFKRTNKLVLPPKNCFMIIILFYLSYVYLPGYITFNE